jgi:hypothetical protein
MYQQLLKRKTAPEPFFSEPIKPKTWKLSSA